MAIFIDENTRVLVQGLTGNQGSFHAEQMLKYGTKVCAGVSPGRGGSEVLGIPVFDTVYDAAHSAGPIDATVIFIPARVAGDAVMEALDAGIRLVVCITEHIPVHDEVKMLSFARRQGATIIGPNTFGVVSSGQSKIGIMPNQFFVSGQVGVVARSGTLSYEIVGNLTMAGLGTSTVVGLGGDRMVGLSFIDVLKLFEQDEQTRAIVMVGEIGGSAEEEAAAYIQGNIAKPVVAYLAGKSAPPGKRMGHAGAIIERGRGTFDGKVQALRQAGVTVAGLPMQVPELVKSLI